MNRRGNDQRNGSEKAQQSSSAAWQQLRAREFAASVQPRGGGEGWGTFNVFSSCSELVRRRVGLKTVDDDFNEGRKGCWMRGPKSEREWVFVCFVCEREKRRKQKWKRMAQDASLLPGNAQGEKHGFSLAQRKNDTDSDREKKKEI
jgi:hypothetical protein